MCAFSGNGAAPPLHVRACCFRALQHAQTAVLSINESIAMALSIRWDPSGLEEEQKAGAVCA